MYFLHARWYFPSMGRFLSADPLRGDPAQPQSLNLYAYVRGNPLNAVDPDGRAALWLTPSRERAMAMAASEAEQFSRWAMEALSYTTWVISFTIPLLTVYADDGHGGKTALLIEDPLFREFRDLFVDLFLKGAWGLRPGMEAAAWGVRDPQTGRPKLVSWGATPEDSKFRLSVRGTGIPAGTVLQVHTHPVRSQGGRFLDPRPSEAEKALAKILGRPVYVLSRGAVWVALPGGEPRQIVTGIWW